MIAHIPDARDLNRFPLRLFKPLFATLSPPDPAGLAGKYEAAFTGPGWLRRSAAPALALGGLRGWWGKDFTSGGGANLVLREDTLVHVLPFRASQDASAIDGKPAVIVRYAAGCPFPWTHICDELRQIEAGRLLGMTRLELPGLRELALPFLLEQRQNGNG
jgi:hypothetical protein